MRPHLHFFETPQTTTPISHLETVTHKTHRHLLNLLKIL